MRRILSPNLQSDFSFGGSTRRDFAVGLAKLVSGIGFAGIASALARAAEAPGFPAGEEISHSAEAIRMELTFNASPARVYDALTDARQFDKVVQLSAAMKSTRLGSKPVEISRDPGGAFSAFGGYVTGRQIELVAGQRIVQAWRAGGWDPGAYSIAKFELSADGKGTKLVFDHTGFPQGDAEHLLDGWKINYWEPLAKFLAQSQ